MFSDLILIHRPGPTGFRFGPDFPNFVFKTCMRSLSILSIDDFEDLETHLSSTADGGARDEIYRGNEAYRFLLQVICGLHSPLIGETEVSGQFKNTVAAYRVPSTPFGGRLARLFKTLFEDAKRVRELHLTDLGSQSYGSIIRRELKGLERLHFVGAGHLVQEILPWLAKERVELHVHGRDPDKIRRDLEAFPDVAVHRLGDRLGQTGDFARAQALILAAPVSAEWVSSWISEDAQRPEIVVDLRGDSELDVVTGFARVLGLGTLLARISGNQAHLEERKQAALAEIDSLVLVRSRHVEYRPFGWEDVCA